jgi:hypothetical protein
MNMALTEEVDLIIHAGDVFDTPKPTGSAMASAAEPMLEAASRGVPVVVVPGNHERSALPSSLLFAHKNIHIVDRPATVVFTLRNLRVAVAAIPCIRRQPAQRFAEAVEATGWSACHADVSILAVHQTFESARCGPVGYRFRSGEDVVERGAVPAEFAYVAAGHVHRHQALEPGVEGGPPIVYSGSPDRVSFAERDEPKGCVLVELGPGGVTHRFIEHPVRPMRIVPLDVTGMNAEAVSTGILDVLASLPADVIASLRLSGRAENGLLKGLKLSQLVREHRPDALISVSTQAIEYVPKSDLRPRLDETSAFDALHAPRVAPVMAGVSDLTALPRGRGVYALYDGARRLLYVGKATDVRARVRSHVRGSNAAGHFDGWTRQIAEVEVRPAHSELEALLVEAELIGRLRPPFNRHMRSWSRYCYVRVTGQAHAELAVSRLPRAGETCYGPYRSRHQAEAVIDAVASVLGTAQCPAEHARAAPLLLFESSGGERLCGRYFDGLCRGPCAERVSVGEYAALLRRRHALLAGLDDGPLVELEALLPNTQGGDGHDGNESHDGCESSDGNESDDGKDDHVGNDDHVGKFDYGEDPYQGQRGRLNVLRSAFEHAATLRAAESLLGGWIVMPGPEESFIVAVPTKSGLRFLPLVNDAGGAEALVGAYRKLVASGPRRKASRLSRSITDTLTLAARYWRADDAAYKFVPHHDARAMTPEDVAKLGNDGPQKPGGPCL